MVSCARATRGLGGPRWTRAVRRPTRPPSGTNNRQAWMEHAMEKEGPVGWPSPTLPAHRLASVRKPDARFSSRRTSICQAILRRIRTRNYPTSSGCVCEVFIDLSVTWNGLGNLRGRIVVPVVLTAMTDKHTTGGFKLSKKVFALHRSVSSASLRTPGISPLVRSQYRSRRLDWRSSNDSPCVQ